MSGQDIRPDYYSGEEDVYEPFKVIRAWKLGFFTGNALKYIRRLGQKHKTIQGQLEDLRKAVTYLNSEINALERELYNEAEANTRKSS